MIRFNKRHVMLMLGLIAPLCSNAADFCIAANGGFGYGGATFVGKNFALPAAGSCTPWAGFTKAASTVIAISSGAACRSSDGKVLEFSISSTDPSYLGLGVIGSDHIRLCPKGTSSCPLGSGNGVGSFSNGSAKEQNCTSAVLTLPVFHD